MNVIHAENFNIPLDELFYVEHFENSGYRHYNYKMAICGHRGKGNQKNFGKKLFTTEPLGALFTSPCGGKL